MGSDREAQILDAALDEIGEANAEAFLKWVTPNLLAPRTDFSEATVRREFARIESDDDSGSGFDREALTVALVERALARIGALVERSTELYAQAAAELRSEEDIAAVAAAITEDLDSYVPGIDSVDDVTGQERMFLLAIATCDRHGRIARLLRDRQQDNVRFIAPIYEAFLARTRRRVATGVTIEQLASAIGMLLDGAALRRRYHPGFDDEFLAAAVMRTFWAFTVAQGDDDPDYVAELVRDL